MKKRIFIGLIVSVFIVVIIYSLMGTFASNNTVSVNDNIYDITLTESTNEVLLPANSSKIVLYQITNTNKGKVKYAVAYTGENIKVKVYNDSIDKETGLMDYGENKFIKLYIENSSSTDSIATLKAILGYENGGELDILVPTGYSLVTEKYTPPQLLTTYISNLYNSADKTVVTNNSIEYNYATSVNLMNDRLGGTTEDYDAGNIRYYGAPSDVNNYVDIGDRDSNGNVIPYRIIGMFKNMEVTNDDGSTEVKDLVKVIRADNISYYSWNNGLSTISLSTDSTKKEVSNLLINEVPKEKIIFLAPTPIGPSEWAESYIMKLLNPGYENNSINGSLWWNSKKGICYREGSTIECDFSSSGLSSLTQNYISKVKWNVGVYDESSTYANTAYVLERETSVTWIGKVALMHISDYGYGGDLSLCQESLEYYPSSSCLDNNWLYKNTSEWLLSPNSSNAVNIISNPGNISSTVTGWSESFSPVFYLNSELTIESGTGTSDNPYVIK